MPKDLSQPCLHSGAVPTVSSAHGHIGELDMDLGIACRIRFTRAVLSASDAEFTARLQVLMPHLAATLERQRAARRQLRAEIAVTLAGGEDAAPSAWLFCRTHDCSDIVDPLGIGIECGIDVPPHALELDDLAYANDLDKRLQLLQSCILSQRRLFVLQDLQRSVSLDDAMKGVELQYDLGTSGGQHSGAGHGAIGGHP